MERPSEGGQAAPNESMDRLWEAYWASNRSHSIRNELVEHYYPMVPWMVARARRRLPPSADFHIVESAAGQALIEAVERFDPQKCPEFCRYARVVMRSRIVDALRHETSVSAHRRSVEQDRPVAASPGRQPSRALPIEQQLRGLLGWGIGGTGESGQEAEGMEPHDLAVFVGRYRSLSTRLKAILYLHFAENIPLKEIAEVLAISRPRVSQLLGEAIARLTGDED